MLAALALLCACDSKGDVGDPCSHVTGDCADGLYCNFPNNDCGAGGPGACSSPDDSLLWDPECGCDGVAYYGPSGWTGAGVDEGPRDLCGLVDTYLECGSLLCRGGDVSYCVRTGLDDECPAFPEDCGDCGCIPDLCPGAECTDLASGHTVVVCPP